MRRILLPALLVWFAIAHAQAQDGSSDASFRTFLPEWEKAQARFIQGDPALWKQHASHGDDVTILGGFGGYGEKGWDAVGARYDWASSRYEGGKATLKVEYVSVVVLGDMALTVGIERQEAPRRELRATQVFRREDGAWKLLHRHADALVEKQ